MRVIERIFAAGDDSRDAGRRAHRATGAVAAAVVVGVARRLVGSPGARPLRRRPTAAGPSSGVRRRDRGVRARAHLRRRVRLASAAASPSSTATTTVGPTCTSPAATSRRRCSGTTARSAARCGSPAGRRRHGADATSTAPTRSTSMATASPTSPSCGTARTCCCAASATAGSSGANEALGPRRRRRVRPTAFSATWEARRSLADARLRQLCRPSVDATGPRRHAGATTASSSGPAGRPRLRRRRSPLEPELVHALDAVQRLGPLGPQRPARQQRPPLLPADDGEEQLWRIDAGEPPRLYTGRRRLGDASRSRAWASPATTSPATACRTST